MLLLTILSIAVLNIVYLTGFFLFSILLKVTERHYFLGYNKAWFTFQIRGVKFSIATHIPIPGLSPVYTIINGEKQSMKYPWGFHEIPIIKRFVATLGGAITLLFFGISVFVAITYFQEDSIITKEEVNRLGIYPSSFAEELGFRRGDKVIAINGKDYEQYADFFKPDLMLSAEAYYTVLREGEEIRIDLRCTMEELVTDNRPYLLLDAPFEVREVFPDGPAVNVGIQAGDRIKKVNGHAIVKYLDMNHEFDIDEDGIVLLEVQRTEGDSIETQEVQVPLDANKRIGISVNELIQYTLKKNSLAESVSLGCDRAFKQVSGEIRAFIKITSGKLNSQRSLGGPIGIHKGHNTNLVFWGGAGETAILFALWNVLPLPRSAFWEILALSYEGITRKKYQRSTFNKVHTLTLKIGWIMLGIWLAWIVIGDILQDVLRNR
jgi:regulator of sigma E protease